jgi:hypothetical protein
MVTAARALLAAGCEPDTPLEMRHEGSPPAALTSKAGIAAKLTVKADDSTATGPLGIVDADAPRQGTPVAPFASASYGAYGP